jgi:hypothetical protein
MVCLLVGMASLLQDFPFVEVEVGVKVGTAGARATACGGCVSLA